MGSELRRMLRLARLVWHLMLGIFTAHVLLGAVNNLAYNNQYRHQRALIIWWNRKLCRIVNLRIHIEGAINPKPTLFVANHISWLDITCLAAVLDGHFIAKDEVGAWPVFGAMAKRGDTLFVKRGDAAITSAVADQMTWRLLQKKNLIMFPEGTSTSGGSVQRFHARLFQSAIRARAEVQAVAIAYPDPDNNFYVNPVAPFVGEDNLLVHLWTLLREPALEIKVTFCKALPVEGKDRRTLADRARAQILATFEPKFGYREDISA